MGLWPRMTRKVLRSWQNGVERKANYLFRHQIQALPVRGAVCPVQ